MPIPFYHMSYTSLLLSGTNLMKKGGQKIPSHRMRSVWAHKKEQNSNHEGHSLIISVRIRATSPLLGFCSIPETIDPAALMQSHSPYTGYWRKGFRLMAAINIDAIMCSKWEQMENSKWKTITAAWTAQETCKQQQQKHVFRTKNGKICYVSLIKHVLHLLSTSPVEMSFTGRLECT